MNGLRYSKYNAYVIDKYNTSMIFLSYFSFYMHEMPGHYTLMYWYFDPSILSCTLRCLYFYRPVKFFSLFTKITKYEIGKKICDLY